MTLFASPRRFICSCPYGSTNYNNIWKLNMHLCRHYSEETISVITKAMARSSSGTTAWVTVLPWFILEKRHIFVQLVL